MYSLMIVDDELIVQRAISHLIETYCPAIKVVGKTGGGMEAVTMALREKPDIVLMDIELAGLDGLEATSEIKKKLPETIFIIISAYDSFNYAKQSISLGVMEYLLKPVSKDDLIAVLAKAVARLEDERRQTREKLELRDKLNKMRPFLEEDLFFSLLYPGIGTHPLHDYPQLLDLKINLGQAVEVYVRDYTWLGKNFERFKQIVRGRMEAKVILFGPIMGRTVLILIGYDSIVPEQLKIWDRIFSDLESNLKVAASIVLGEVYQGFDGMIKSLRELRNSARFYDYQPGVYRHSQFQCSPDQTSPDLYLMEQEFFGAIKSGRHELAGLVFNDLFRIAEITFNNDFQSLKDYFLGIIAVLRRLYFEAAPDHLKVAWDKNYPSQRINCVNDINEILIIFDKIANEFSRLNESGVFPEKISEIKAAVEFMEKNYHRELNLSDIAAAVAISPGYLAKLFKEYRNQTVMDYLERTRIEQALKLLKETQYSIKEIAGRVGYKDPNYFSKVFKKVTKFSPTEIRS